MTEQRPILLFGRNSESPNPSPPGGSLKPFDAKIQIERLSPVFDNLKSQFINKNIKFHPSEKSYEPERTLVIEIKDSLPKFFNALKNISGFEHVGEMTNEQVRLEGQFDEDPERVKGTVYIMIANRVAMDQFIRLWDIYCSDPRRPFDRGLKEFKNLFSLMVRAYYWGEKQRCIETGLEDFLLKYDNWPEVSLEIEIWYKSESSKRKEDEKKVKELVYALNGTISDKRCIDEIRYHAVLAKIPTSDNPEEIIAKIESTDGINAIKYVHPVVQQTKDDSIKQIRIETDTQKESENSKSPPVAALMDGIPIQEHQSLHGRIIVDDILSIGDNLPPDERNHGTAMASLILHGDIERMLGDDEGNVVQNRPLLVIPVMGFYNPVRNKYDESVPIDELFVGVLYDVFNKMSAKGWFDDIRIINMSLGDMTVFTRSVSAWARLMDWVAHKYNLLVMISAGNHNDLEIEGKKRTDFDNDHELLQRSSLESILEHSTTRRIRPPAEGINVLTIGSSNTYVENDQYPNFVQLFRSSSLPAPYSAIGMGVHSSIKPDILFPGGGSYYNISDTTNGVKLKLISQEAGNLVASTTSQGDTDTYHRTCGTSNAAALATKEAIKIHDILRELLRSKPQSKLNDKAILTNTIKTLLVHNAQKYKIDKNLELILSINNESKRKKISTRLSGYGVVDGSSIVSSTPTRITMIGGDTIKHKMQQKYTIPGIPYQTVLAIKKLTSTLAWNSRINPSLRNYRLDKLELKVSNPHGLNTKYTDYHDTRRGTIQHEVREWSNNYWDESAIEITVSARVSASDDSGHIKPEDQIVPYAFAVSIELAEEITIDTFNLLKNRIEFPGDPIRL